MFFEMKIIFFAFFLAMNVVRNNLLITVSLEAKYQADKLEIIKEFLISIFIENDIYLF